MPVCQVTVVPLGTKTPSLSSYVADCQKVLARYDDLTQQLTPMATIMEGKLSRILEAVQEMHEAPFRRGVQRVATTLVIDDRRDKPLTMKAKVTAVEEKLAADE
jgi:uncharacterized protein (TIGR00106 family)